MRPANPPGPAGASTCRKKDPERREIPVALPNHAARHAAPATDRPVAVGDRGCSRKCPRPHAAPAPISLARFGGCVYPEGIAALSPGLPRASAGSAGLPWVNAVLRAIYPERVSAPPTRGLCSNPCRVDIRLGGRTQGSSRTRNPGLSACYPFRIARRDLNWAECLLSFQDRPERFQLIRNRFSRPGSY